MLFVVTFLVVLGLLAWLSTRYGISTNWSSAGRAALSDSTVELLQRMDDPLDMVAFVRPDDLLADHVTTLATRIKRHKADLRYRTVNPDRRPDLVREFQVEENGEIILEFRGRQERVKVPSEPRLAAAMERLYRADDRPIVFMTAHGERSLEGEANHDLGAFGNYLRERGHPLKALASGEAIPGNAAVLVVTGPRTALQSGVRQRIERYLENGGNLLWLVDDRDQEHLDFLARHLSVELLPGRVVEPRAEELLGVDNPRLLALANYEPHPALDDLEGVSLFVDARALEARDDDDADDGETWDASELVMTDERHWVETGDPESPEFDAETGDIRGPLQLGMSLERMHPAQPEGEGSGEQRVVVMGDADFLSNAYLGNGVNLNLGLRLVEWLSAGDGVVAVHGQATVDQQLDMERTVLLALGAGFLLVLPALFLIAAGALWWRRRRG